MQLWVNVFGEAFLMTKFVSVLAVKETFYHLGCSNCKLIL